MCCPGCSEIQLLLTISLAKEGTWGTLGGSELLQGKKQVGAFV